MDVFLYSKGKKVVNCNKPTAGTATPTDRSDTLLCATQSDVAGEFSFGDLPCGEYTVVPFYKRTTTTFDVVPSQAAVSLTHGTFTMPEPFQVMGFSASGRVVDKAGSGIEGATIKVNSVEKTVTDKEGYYTLDKVTTGEYMVQASKPHYFFHDIKNHKLSPSVSALPDITVVKYHVCGRINSDKVTGPRTVNLKNSQFQTSTQTDDHGHYCFEVAPSEYEISPVLSAAEKSQGILLSPPTRTVTVTTLPLLMVDFVQARVSLSGSVKCLGNCDTAIKVSLSAHNRDQENLSANVDKNGKFSFANILPGQYKASIHYDTWCWEQKEVDVTVQYQDYDHLEFLQSGYVLHSSLSHDITLNILMDGETEHKSFSLKKGTNRFCLAKKGIYKLTPVSCYRFEKDEYTYDTSAPKVLELQAKDYKVHGLILVSSAPEFFKVTSIPVDIKPLSSDGSYMTEEGEQIQAQYTKTAKISSVETMCENGLTENCIDAAQGNTEVRVYEYSYWSPPGDRFEILPPTTTDQSKSFMYYPRSMEVSLNRKSCPPAVKPFHGRPGLFLKGSVTPAVGGVKIIVRSTKSSATDKPFLNVLTSKDGTYSAGPLHDDEQYTVSALADGYHFKEEKTGHFRALKLGEIVSSAFVDGDKSKPLEGVLLSLSGDSYRDNNETEKNGIFAFTGLFPGSYFLRPLLKEYKFEPASQSIEVTEAGTIEAKFNAVRIAYSVFGSVLSLNMEPENGLVIEAVQVLEKNLTEDGKPIYPRYEETITDANGDYRLRGLMPNSQYNIRIKKGKKKTHIANARIERSSPEFSLINVGTSDVADISYTAFRKLTKFDLTGVVEVKDQSDWVDTVEVVLTLESSSFSVLQASAVSKSFTFFEFPSLPEGIYLVYARSSLSKATHTFTSTPTRVDLTKHSHITVNFEAILKPASQEPTQGSFLSVVLAVIVVGLVIYREQVEEAFDNFQRQSAAKSKAAAAINNNDKNAAKKEAKAKFSKNKSQYK